MKTLEKEAWKLRPSDFTELVGNIKNYIERCGRETAMLGFREDSMQAIEYNKKFGKRVKILKAYDGACIIAGSVITLFGIAEGIHHMIYK
jgi:hypothetical protein